MSQKTAYVVFKRIPTQGLFILSVALNEEVVNREVEGLGKQQKKIGVVPVEYGFQEVNIVE